MNIKLLLAKMKGKLIIIVALRLIHIFMQLIVKIILNTYNRNKFYMKNVNKLRLK